MQKLIAANTRLKGVSKKDTRALKDVQGIIVNVVKHDRSNHDNKEVEEPVCRRGNAVRSCTDAERCALSGVQPGHAKPSDTEEGIKHEAVQVRMRDSDGACTYSITAPTTDPAPPLPPFVAASLRTPARIASVAHMPIAPNNIRVLPVISNHPTFRHHAPTPKSLDSEDGHNGCKEVLRSVTRGQDTRLDIAEVELVLEERSGVVGTGNSQFQVPCHGK